MELKPNGSSKGRKEQDGRLKLKQYIPLGGSLEREASRKGAKEGSDAETTGHVFNDGVVKNVNSCERSRRIEIKKR